MKRFAILAALSIPILTQAADSTWLTPTGGNYTDPLNWNPAVPSATDDAVFSQAGTYTVTFPGALQNAHAFKLRNGDLTFELGGSIFDVAGDFTTGYSIIGENAGESPSLALSNGQLRADHLTLGVQAGSTGALTLVNPGALLNIDTRLQIGVYGTGDVSVTNGAALKLGNGFDSKFLEVNNGQLQISGAATTASLSRLVIGNRVYDSIGHATIDSGVQALATYTRLLRTGSTLNLDGAGTLLRVWQDLSPDAGTVSITNGARIRAASLEIDSPYAGDLGTLIIDGAGSQLELTGSDSIMGWAGDAQIEVTNGGALLFNNGRYDDTGLGGSNVTSNPDASLLVSGAGSLVYIYSSFYVAGRSYVPNGSPASITVNNGGTVLVDGNDLHLYPKSTTLIGPGGTLRAGYVYLEPGSSLQVDAAGVFQGTTFRSSDLNMPSGILELGQQNLHIINRVDQGNNLVLGAQATMRVDINGDVAGTSHERMEVLGGDAYLDGTLELVFGPTFEAEPGFTFDILTAATISGEFATVVSDYPFAPGEELQLDIQYLHFVNLDDVLRVTVLGSAPSGDPIDIPIDIDPWSTANEVSPDAYNGKIVIAIPTTSVANGDTYDFDAAQVQPSSVRVGPGQAINVYTPWIVDFDGDSDFDMLLGFQTQDTGVVCGDTELSLTGLTYPGNVEFSGTDAITTITCEVAGCHP